MLLATIVNMGQNQDDDDAGWVPTPPRSSWWPQHSDSACIGFGDGWAGEVVVEDCKKYRFFN